jgi:hypothetical protein
MKSSHIFWGILFLTLGTLILIDNVATVNINWGFIWNLWPLVLIILGLLFFMRGTEYKWIVVAIIALLIGLFVFAGYQNITDVFQTNNFDDDNFDVEYFNQPYQKETKKASLFVNCGVGSIVTNDTTGELISIKSKGGWGKYSFSHDIHDDYANLYFEMEDKHFRWRSGMKKNHVEMKLNPNPVWDMEYEVGAEGVDLDLSKFKISSLAFKSGVSWIKVKLGDKSDSTKIKFDSGVSKLRIYIPKNVGCDIEARTELTKKRFEGFIKTDSHYYQTENFNNTKKKVWIDMKADVSNVAVERY